MSPEGRRAVAPPDNDVLWSRALTACQGGRQVLRGVSVNVREAELLALTGPRGSGKSTLLACLSGTMPAERGEVWFNSSPVHTLSTAGRERLRREHFGFLGPVPHLVGELTAAENVAVTPLLRGARRKAADRTAGEWLERLELMEYAGIRPPRLSRELRQRVALARALAGAPSVVFADDPTACLDSDAGERLLRVLTTAVRSHGITMVLATADSEIAAHADREIALVDGRRRVSFDRGAGLRRSEAKQRQEPARTAEPAELPCARGV